jgi:hypothetical protein
MKFDPKQWSFHWQGKNRQGVSKWTGSEKPLLWLGRIFTAYGPIAGLGGLIALLYGLVSGTLAGGAGTLGMVGLIHGVVFTGIGLWALAMYRRIRTLSRPEQVCATLGLDDTLLEKIVVEKGIKPRIIINERPYYDLNDFTDAGLLLRASSAPAAQPETLLRPASGSAEAAPDTLLRAAASTAQENEPKLSTGQDHATDTSTEADVLHGRLR